MFGLRRPRPRSGQPGQLAPLGYTDLQAASPPKSIKEILEASGLGSYAHGVSEAKLDLDIVEHLRPADLFHAFGEKVPFGDCVRIILALQNASEAPADEKSTRPRKRGLWTCPSMLLEAAEQNGDLHDRMSTWTEMGAVITTLFLSIELSMRKSKVSDCGDVWTGSSCQRIVVAQNVLRCVGLLGTCCGCVYSWGVIAGLQMCDETQLSLSVRKDWGYWGSFVTGTGLLGACAFALSLSLQEMIESHNLLDVALAQALSLGVCSAVATFNHLVFKLTGASGHFEAFSYVLGWTSFMGFYGPREPS